MPILGNNSPLPGKSTSHHRQIVRPPIATINNLAKPVVHKTEPGAAHTRYNTAAYSYFTNIYHSLSDVVDIHALIKARWAKGFISTRIGSRGLIQLRAEPGQEPMLSKDMAEEVKRQPELSPAADPKLFDISASAYLQMVTERNDQTIVIRGERHSGKTYNMQQITRYLCDLGRVTKKKTAVAALLEQTHDVFTSFASTQLISAYGPITIVQDSSGCMRYDEYQYNSDGKIVGAKIIPYHLNLFAILGASRQTTDLITASAFLRDVSAVAGNFKIFYQLLEGASPTEREEWHLGDPRLTFYAYLSDVKLIPATVQDESGNQFNELRKTLKSVDIGHRQQFQIFQILAAILHLGNVNFENGPDEKKEPTKVSNIQQLVLVAKLLGIDAANLEASLLTRSRMIGRDNVSTFVDVIGSEKQRDALAQTLYTVVFSWIIEHLNTSLCKDEKHWSNFIAVLDTPGFAFHNHPSGSSRGYHQFMSNYTNERLYEFTRNVFLTEATDLRDEQDEHAEHVLDFPTNKKVLECLIALRSGVVTVLNHETAQGEDASNDAQFLETIQIENADIATFTSTKEPTRKFGVRHFGGGACEYDPSSWTWQNTDSLLPEFVSLVRGTLEDPGTTNQFLRSLFSTKLLEMQTHEADRTTVIRARSLSRAPSTRRKTNAQPRQNGAISRKKPKSIEIDRTVAYQYTTALTDLLDAVKDTTPWFIFCIRPSMEASINEKWDSEAVKRQLKALGVSYLSQNIGVRFSVKITLERFAERYQPVLDRLLISGKNTKVACEKLMKVNDWSSLDVVCGRKHVFLSDIPWRFLENAVRTKPSPTGNPRKGKSPGSGSKQSSPKHSNTMSVDDDRASHESDAMSHFESEFGDETPPGEAMEINDRKEQMWSDASHLQPILPMTKAAPAEKDESRSKGTLKTQRGRWMCLTWAMTWWIPSWVLSCCCRMTTRSRRLAWREKLTLCILIFLMNCFVLFFIIVFGKLICPQGNELSPGQISTLTDVNSKAAVYMYGRYYEISSIARAHLQSGYPNSDPHYWSNFVLGTDVSPMFSKLPVWGDYCPSYALPANFSLFPLYNFGGNHQLWMYHTSVQGSSNVLRSSVITTANAGPVVLGPSDINNILSANRAMCRVITAYDHIYDITPFFAEPYYGSGNQANFFGQDVTNIFNSEEGRYGGDVTSKFEFIRASDPNRWANIMQCMNGVFIVGYVDHRFDLQCMISDYILLGSTVIVVAVIGVKFLASLQLLPKPAPELQDKFVICQIACYTEDERSLRRTIDSLTKSDYKDSRRLLFIVADGMVIGTGNDRPTPRIVLDILGVDPEIEVPSLAYQALGEGNKQMNFAKVYSGVYSTDGRASPFIVVVKVGKPSERQRPGNRGKRDSQLILMQFLSRVHFVEPMNPVELEIHHHMTNEIGVNPFVFEFVLMIDADTVVQEDAINQLVSHMNKDLKIAGISGETKLANERRSWVTMVQVYEYFVSHHMAKAFESLFGSVTCLPGCFCMYRVRLANTNRPILVSQSLLKDYSENRVDSLHLKNLLHLGEDRYLTTLMMKHFPDLKTRYTPFAQCATVAPDTWKVLRSQRRRWINSTVHNLFELLFIEGMCSTCCLSMRFVVLLDLVATFVQPASVLYILYLIYTYIYDKTTAFPLISIIMLSAIYGLQVFFFVIRGQLQNVGWMVFYILAMPLFAFYLPIYAFWNFDDFSWGNTRVVLDAGGRRVEKDIDEAPFDSSQIPLMTWKHYEKMRIAAIPMEKRNSADIAHSDYNHRGSVARSNSVKSISTFKGSHQSSNSAGANGVYANMAVATATNLRANQPQRMPEWMMNNPAIVSQQALISSGNITSGGYSDTTLYPNLMHSGQVPTAGMLSYASIPSGMQPPSGYLSEYGAHNPTGYPNMLTLENDPNEYSEMPETEDSTKQSKKKKDKSKEKKKKKKKKKEKDEEASDGVHSGNDVTVKSEGTSNIRRRKDKSSPISDNGLEQDTSPGKSFMKSLDHTFGDIGSLDLKFDTAPEPKVDQIEVKEKPGRSDQHKKPKISNNQDAGIPSDFDIEVAIREFFMSVDLATVTKRHVREHIEDKFGIKFDSAGKKTLYAILAHVVSDLAG